MGCAASTSAKYDFAKEEGWTAETAEPSDETAQAAYPSGEWRVEEAPNEWIPLDQGIGAQLLEAYCNGQVEAQYLLPTGSFHVDFYNQLQTHQETGRQCRIAWFEAAFDANAAAQDVQEPVAPEVYLGGEWLIEEGEGRWVRLDHEISAQLLVAWYCGEQRMDYALKGRTFEVDLTVWEHRDLETGERKRIVWNSSDASGGLGSQEASECGSVDGSTWLDPGEEAERQLFMALNSGQPVVRYNVNGCEFEVDVANMVQTNLETGERWMIAVEETQTEQKGATDQASTAAPDKTETAATEATEVPPEETAFAAGASEPRQVPTATGRPKAFIYKAIPDPSRPPPKQKKWSLAPGGHRPRLAPKGAKASAKPKSGPNGNIGEELSLPKNVEWPKGDKARRVAETVYKDMQKSREKPLAHRRRAYMAACLSWHPDKNLKHQEVATQVFQFLQAVKDWYFET